MPHSNMPAINMAAGNFRLPANPAHPGLSPEEDMVCL